MVRLRDALIDDGRVSPAEFDRVLTISGSGGEHKSVPELLVALGIVSESDMADVFANLYDLAVASGGNLLQTIDVDTDPSVRFLKENKVFPIRVNDSELGLVMADPGNTFSLRALGLFYRDDLKPVVGVPSEIEHAIEQSYGSGMTAIGQIVGEDDRIDDLADLDVEQLKDMASEAPVIRLVNLLLQRAAERSASDIHIEPFDGVLKVRYRIDGVLHDTEAPPANLAPAVISRIKIMARLNIAERRLPQDGRIKLRIQGKEIDARVSTVPTMHGESVVMRLLNRGDVELDLSSLGYSDKTREQLLNALSRPHGMVLVTGPTGSGKTTTLYTAIQTLNTEERKIITAEDPVEYQIDGINQIQVQPGIGLSFASVLRSIVRQDPDVILVGEMRDLETAQICVQSALTGHLVLSTLHTNSAASTITRLLEMGIEDYLLSSTINAIVSQRLVRKLCPVCRQAYDVSPEELKRLGLGELPFGKKPRFFHPEGCDDCNQTGYKGRLAILELMPITDELRNLMLSSRDAKVIEAAALKGGMRGIFQDGCDKVLAGLTSIEEVLRVIKDAH